MISAALGILILPMQVAADVSEQTDNHFFVFTTTASDCRTMQCIYHALACGYGRGPACT